MNPLLRRLALACLPLLFAACAQLPAPKPPPPPPKAEGQAAYRLGEWSALPGWREDELSAAWGAVLQSCRSLKAKPAWDETCAAASQLKAPSNEEIRGFFEARLLPYRNVNPDGSEDGLVTGYSGPLRNGSRSRSARFRDPHYGGADDRLTIDLAWVYPELKSLRLRGRMEGRKVVPYWNRGEIESGTSSVKGKELFWVDDAIDLFFLQIQGSGRIQLPDGSLARVGYADQNGHPDRSVGKRLVDSGELPLEKASMQGIKDWATKNPAKLKELLDYNASYVFFRELPSQAGGLLGALGGPLTEARSIAVDPRYVTLGAPVYLAATWPNSTRPLQRLMMAQDTGGAIRGAVRAAFFWGFGPEAGKLAGALRQRGQMWLLLPKGAPLPGGNP